MGPKGGTTIGRGYGDRVLVRQSQLAPSRSGAVTNYNGDDVRGGILRGAVHSGTCNLIHHKNTSSQGNGRSGIRHASMMLHMVKMTRWHKKIRLCTR